MEEREVQKTNHFNPQAVRPQGSQLDFYGFFMDFY